MEIAIKIAIRPIIRQIKEIGSQATACMQFKRDESSLRMDLNDRERPEPKTVRMRVISVITAETDRLQCLYVGLRGVMGDHKEQRDRAVGLNVVLCKL